MQASNPLSGSNDGGCGEEKVLHPLPIGGSMLLSTSCMPGEENDDDDDDEMDLALLRAAAARGVAEGGGPNSDATTTTTIGDLEDDLPELAGQRGLQSTVNPDPLDIVASKILLRKEEGGGAAYNASYGGGENRRKDGIDREDHVHQWGSVVNKPMKANQNFYDDAVVSSCISRSAVAPLNHHQGSSNLDVSGSSTSGNTDDVTPSSTSSRLGDNMGGVADPGAAKRVES